jgi:hypothetical protein
MRAFYRIASIIGTGTNEDAYRPAHTDTLTGWAACYKGATEALVLAETPDPSALAKLANVSFVGLFGDVQADVANLQDKVAATLNDNAGITSAAWGDTMIGDWRREDEMTDAEYALAVCAYPAWATGKAYKVGDLCSYAAALYEVVQAHTSQADWTPPVVPALFTRRSPAGVIPQWVQPVGAQDAYAQGALVVFEGRVYESLIAANVWSPTVYPAGWKVR